MDEMRVVRRRTAESLATNLLNVPARKGLANGITMPVSCAFNIRGGFACDTGRLLLLIAYLNIASGRLMP